MTKKSTTLYCFSPPVMLATFIIEIVLIIYTVWRYKLNAVTRLVIAILAALATFQLAEYMVCGGANISAEAWAKLGFISITILPPLGIHLASQIAGGQNRSLVWSSYGLAAVFVSFFLLVSNAIEHKVCGGNYIIFNMTSTVDPVYALYYYGLLVTGVIYCMSKAGSTSNKSTRSSLYGFALGYVLFLLPTTTLNLIEPGTTRAIPSIMCGFAVILAFVTVFWILPRAAQLRRKKSFWQKLGM